MTAAALPAPSAVTAEELAALSGDGAGYELVEGELQAMTPAGYGHGRVAARALGRVLVFVEDHHLGEVVTAETGFVLHRGPDTVRAPDVAFVRADRVPADDDQAGYAELAPDLVVEVVSPSDRAGRVNATALAWLDAGVRLVWVVYPETRSVAVHRPEGAVTVLRDDAVLDGGDVLPGFMLALPDLFRRG